MKVYLMYCDGKVSGVYASAAAAFAAIGSNWSEDPVRWKLSHQGGDRNSPRELSWEAEYTLMDTIYDRHEDGTYRFNEKGQLIKLGEKKVASVYRIVERPLLGD